MQLEHQEYGTDDEDDEYGGYMAEGDETHANKFNQVLLNARAMDDLEFGDKYEVPADLLHGNERPITKEIIESAADVIRRCVEYANKYDNEDENEDVIIVQESSDDDSDQWDCETIVSTYSNLDKSLSSSNAATSGSNTFCTLTPTVLEATLYIDLSLVSSLFTSDTRTFEASYAWQVTVRSHFHIDTLYRLKFETKFHTLEVENKI